MVLYANIIAFNRGTLIRGFCSTDAKYYKISREKMYLMLENFT